MSRRAERRRSAILGALWEYGAQTESGICARLRYGVGTLHVDLVWLEHNRLVVSEWEPEGFAGLVLTDAGQLRPRRRLYRLPNDAERGAFDTAPGQ